MAESIDEQQRLQYGIIELFSPVTGPTRPSKESVRFGLGELEKPGTVFSHWPVVRGLVTAFQEVAPTAWSEIKAWAQGAEDEMYSQRIKREEPEPRVVPEEPDWWDQLLLAHAAIRCQKAGVPLEMPGLRPEAEEIAASAYPGEPLTIPNPTALQAWRAKWKLANDRSLFTVAVVLEAVNATDRFRQVSATNIAWVTFASLLDSGLVNASTVPGWEPPFAGSPETAPLTPSPQTFRFEIPAFSPRFDTEVPFRAAAREAFERELDAHIAGRRADLTGRGFAPVPVKRVPDDHFRWYIRYQVLEQSYNEIAHAECVTPGAVYQAVRGVVDLAGVPRRKPKPAGRPKKKPPSGSKLSS
jgi:hypothetical protein